MKNGLKGEPLVELLEFLMVRYSDLMDGWEKRDCSDIKDISKCVAGVYGTITFDLMNVLLLMKGDYERAHENTEMFKDTGSFSVVLPVLEDDDKAEDQSPDKAEDQDVWPRINAPGGDPKDPDPSSWN